MAKKELLKKPNWSKKDIGDYFGITVYTVTYRLKKAHLQPTQGSKKEYPVNAILNLFGTSLDEEIKKTTI